MRCKVQDSQAFSSFSTNAAFVPYEATLSPQPVAKFPKNFAIVLATGFILGTNHRVASYSDRCVTIPAMYDPSPQ